jgi:hypothetical protein
MDYFPRRWLRELHVVCDAHLFCFMQAALELAGGDKWPTFFSVVWCREAFQRPGGQDVAEFDSN